MRKFEREAIEIQAKIESTSMGALYSEALRLHMTLADMRDKGNEKAGALHEASTRRVCRRFSKWCDE